MRKITGKIVNIIKAKTRRNEWQGEWHKKRYEICKGCEFNSIHNRPKGTSKITHFFLNLMNGFKVFCTICGCSIKDKTSIEIERCSLKQSPKWTEHEYN